MMCNIDVKEKLSDKVNLNILNWLRDVKRMSEGV